MVALAAMTVSLHAAKKDNWNKIADKRKAEYVFMEAQRQNAIENEDAYFELLEHAYNLDPTKSDVGFYLGYYQLAMAGNDSVLFNRGYHKMGEHFKRVPEDFYATYLYGNINEKLGKQELAIGVWATLDSLFPQKTEVALKHAEALNATRDSANIKKALSIYERIENGEGKNTTISTRKVRAFFALKDTSAIINEIHSLLESSPESAEYNVFAADIFSIFQENDSALFYYNRACEMDSTSGLAYYSRANFYKNQGDSAIYDREVFRALKQESLDLDVKLGLLSNYIKALYEDTEQQPRIQELFDILLEQHPHEEDIHDLYCSYLVAIKDYGSAAEQLSYALDINPGNENQWRALMSLYAQDNNYLQAAETGVNALHFHPDNTLILLLTGINYNSAKEYDSSHYYLNKALNLTDSLDFEMKSSILSSIGDMYFSANEKDSAFVYYDKAIAVNPKNLLALNNCAYYLACEGRDLERAEQMSAITIKEEPENSTSLDTYAWVLFKMKNYSRAKYYIDEALKFSDEFSEEILHHAGDIYFMAGEPEKAVEFWEQALEFAPDNELLQRKVKHQTYFYK